MTESKRKRTRKAPAKTDAKVTKTVRTKVFGEEKEEQDVEVMPFEVEPAYVRAAIGTTRNLGDYESLRIDVAVTIPCYVETINETYEEAAEWVAEKLEEELELFAESQGGGSAKKKKGR